ncbi:MAG: hypothetical protein JOZ69_23745, partial [Myxococcales bacterium]|nr:hypothetical protein [Myxococcales bacterium]
MDGGQERLDECGMEVGMIGRRGVRLAALLALVAGCKSGDDHAQNGADAGAATESGVAAVDGGFALQSGQLLATGYAITPTAARGSIFQPLSPHPGLLADHASAMATSPDGKTLLVLTSGYNLRIETSGPDAGAPVPGDTGEWIFVYDVSSGPPVQRQVLQIPNSYAGLAFHPNGTEFYVAGGKDDDVHVFDLSGGAWAEAAPAIALGHGASSSPL